MSEPYDYDRVLADLAMYADPQTTWTSEDGYTSPVLVLRRRIDIAKSVLDRLIFLGWRPTVEAAWRDDGEEQPWG
jgi:hypothetical protein